MLCFVVAISENNIIGKNGSLPWHLPNDLKKFKAITTSHSKIMIMGRKTFESLPSLLPGRVHVILTKNKNYYVESKQVNVIHEIEDLRHYIDSSEEYFVIGGGEIFSLLMPYTKRMYLTIIHGDFSGDTYFPAFNKDQWIVVNSDKGLVDENNKYPHTFLTLDRI